MARRDRAIQWASVREPIALYTHLDGPHLRAMTVVRFAKVSGYNLTRVTP
jgi:hypothetical protein